MQGSRSTISNPPAVLAVVACLGLAACGDLDFGPPRTVGGTGDMSQLLPLKTGNSWTYLVTNESGGPIPKTQLVMGEEPVGGTGPNAAATAFRMVTRKGADRTHLTVSWQARVGTRVVRYRELGFSETAPYDMDREDHWEPGKLRVDETPDHMVAGETWLELYKETRVPVGARPSTREVRDRWTVVAERHPVTVQGRRYQVLILVKDGPDPKTYWWARGIGKVKEIGPDVVEELVSYVVVP
jgi:hypothetical protein